MCFWNNNTKGRKHACMRNVFFCVSYVSPFPVSFSVSKAGFPVQKVSHGHGDCDTGCSCLGRGAANGSVDDHGSGCGRWCGRVRIRFSRQNRLHLQQQKTKKVICRRCNQETAEEDALCQEKFRLDLRWTCKACHALLTQLKPTRSRTEDSVVGN